MRIYVAGNGLLTCPTSDMAIVITGWEGYKDGQALCGPYRPRAYFYRCDTEPAGGYILSLRPMSV